MDLVDFTALVASLVRDDDGRLVASDIDTAVSLALERYSEDRPRSIIEDVVATSKTLLAMPASWLAGVSFVKEIEYPIDESPRQYLPRNFYSVYKGPAGYEGIQTDRSVFVIGASARVTFTGIHSAPDTVDAGDTELVASYGAAFLCEQLAAFYGHTTGGVISSDSVDHVNKGRDFALRAKSLRGRYEGKFGVRTSSQAASQIKVLEQRNAGGGRRLFH